MKNLLKPGRTSENDKYALKWFVRARSSKTRTNWPLIQGKGREVNSKWNRESDVSDWSVRLKDLIKGYVERNIYNRDQRGLFFRVLPDAELTLKGETSSERKISKGQPTILLCETTIIIGEAKKPRCFREINVNEIDIENGSRTWIKKICKQSRKILLFLDNASSHWDIQFPLPNLSIKEP